MVIGITGGVGSGKSSVMNILMERYGARVIITDDIAKKLQEPGGESYELIVREFGEDILDTGTACTDPPIDRKKLAQIVLSDRSRLELLNSLTHPQVRSRMEQMIQEAYEEDPEALIAAESALFVEAGFRDILDELWAVITDKETRIERLRISRGYSRKKALSFMANQKSDEQYASEADFCIDNSGDIEAAAAQIAERLNIIIK